MKRDREVHARHEVSRLSTKVYIPPGSLPGSKLTVQYENVTYAVTVPNIKEPSFEVSLPVKNYVVTTTSCQLVASGDSIVVPLALFRDKCSRSLTFFCVGKDTFQNSSCDECTFMENVFNILCCRFRNEGTFTLQNKMHDHLSDPLVSISSNSNMEHQMKQYKEHIIWIFTHVMCFPHHKCSAETQTTSSATD